MIQFTWKALLCLAVALAAFAYWGLFTQAGGRAFDEMDGMIPFFAGVASPILAAAGALLWFLGRRKPPAPG